MRVTVWNEYGDSQKSEQSKAVYPGGIHQVIAGFLETQADMQVSTALQSQPQHGLSPEVLDNTDVLIWWAHCHHGEVDDEVVSRVVDRVQRGMGIIFLHSAHVSKPFLRLLGTTGSLLWREADERERIWVIEPTHPICKGIPASFDLNQEEMYGERFDIPVPDELLMIGTFKGGEVFRSAITYKRGLGKVFYFQPGHETYPTYYNENIQKIIINAVRWACPEEVADNLSCRKAEMDAL